MNDNSVPKPIDPEILANMRTRGSVEYVPNPRTTKRNQCVYDLNEPTFKNDQDHSDVFEEIEERNGDHRLTTPTESTTLPTATTES